MIILTSKRRDPWFFWSISLLCDSLACNRAFCGDTESSKDPDRLPERQHISLLKEAAKTHGWSLTAEGIYCPDCAPTHAKAENDRR